MSLAVFTAIGVLLTPFGYVLAVCYMKKLKPSELSVKKLLPDTLYRKLYIIIAVVICIGVITAFELMYPSVLLVHKAKLLILILLMIPAAAVDLKMQKIPNVILLTALAVRAVLYVVEIFWYPYDILTVLSESFLGGAVIGGFFLLLLLVFKNSIGMGDVKLFAVMGLYQGIWGALTSVFFSLSVMFVLSIILLITKKKTGKDTVSFAPAILAGTVAAVILTGI